MVLNLVGMELSVPEVIWTIISFVVFYYILKRILYKPILSHIYEREEIIEEGKRAGQKAQEALEESRRKVEADIEEAQEQARDHIIHSRMDAQRDRHFAIEAARRKASALRMELLENLAEEEARGKVSLEEQLPEFIAILTNKMMGEDTVTEQDALIARIIESHKEM